MSIIERVRAYIGGFPCEKSLCMEIPEWIDPMGRHWCAKHGERRHVIRYGYCHGWPRIVDSFDVVLEEGETSYLHAVKMWKDDAIAPVIEFMRPYVAPYQKKEEKVAS